MTGGLLLEQAAQCCLRFRKPALRHYAFRMTLAAMRYGRAKQPQLSARCYSLALNILKGSQWSLAEDHLNENFAKQALLLNDLPTALASFRSLVTVESKQTASKQSFYLTEFLGVMQKASLVCPDIGRKELPELCLPVIDRQHVKVMLGAPMLSVEDAPVQARGIHFSDDEHDDEDDRRLFRTASSSFFFQSRNSTAPSSPPSWMCSADRSDDENEKNSPEAAFDFNRVEESERPISKDPFVSLLYSRPDYRLASGAVYRRLEALLELHSQEGKPSSNPCLVCLNYSPPRPQSLPVGERLTVQVPLHNPWLIPLILTDVQLLWRATFPASFSSSDVDLFSTSFAPTAADAAGQPKQTTNEANGEDLRNARKYITTDSVNEFYMLAGDKKMIELGIRAKQVCASIELLGLAFNLNVSSPNQPQQTHHRSLSSVERYDISNARGSSSSSLITSGLASMSAASSQTSLASTLNGDKLIPKFTMSPDDSELDLSSLVSAQPPDPLADRDSAVVTPSLVNPLLPSTLVHNPVRGKLLFVSSTSASKVSGTERSGPKDNRFTWSVVPPLPLLSVSFDGFPQQLFEGEIHSLRLNLTNSGLEPLRNVRFISSWPGFFVFATKDICLTSRLESNPIDFIQRLPLLDGDLAPSACVEQPLWLRAPLLSARKRTFASSTLLPPPWPTSAASQTSSSTALAAPHPPVSAHVKQVHLVFSYSAANPSIAASSGPRYLRHKALLKLLPSLRIQATTCQTYGSSVGNLLLTLQCKNVSKETTFSITQLTSCSRRWSIELVWPQVEEEVGFLIAPCQEVTICLRAKVSPSTADCSSVSLCSPTEGPPVDVTALPFSGFLRGCATTKKFSKTPAQEAIYMPVERPKIDGINSTKANSTGEVDFSEFRLIAFWKVITSNTDSLSDRLGLSRICISLQNRKPFESILPLPQAASGTRHLPPPTSTSLIRLRLLHPSRISHCFSKRSQSLAPPALNEVSSMALVPVVAEVYNASSVPVLVRLEAADIDSRGSRLPLGPLHSLDSSAPPPKPGIEPYRGSVSLPSVLWIGISLRHFRLEAAESRKLHLEARVCEVGVYDVMGGLRVSAAPVRPDDASPNFVNQTCNYSSLLVVEATTTSCGRGS
uniref:Trafficking protein particle complex subunit 8 n=1 Tax=Schistocephalus solidus TaxID=70667 RepID=A0A0X3NHT0_SCHSO